MKRKIFFKILISIIAIITIFSNVSFAIVNEEIKENVLGLNSQNNEQNEKISTKNEYDESTNKVTVQVISNVEFKPTKASTWKLSEDKKIYSKIYDENTNYTTVFEDKLGNQHVVNIVVTQIQKQKANLKLNYIYDKDTNIVTVQVISNMEFKPTKAGTWKLSEDKKIYSKIYDENTNYTTVFEDKLGNQHVVNIVVTQIQKQKANLKLNYIYDKDINKVTVQVISNVEFKPTKASTWELSKDKKIYSKIYDENTNYTTIFEDKLGNQHVVNIIVTQIQKQKANLKLNYVYDEITNKVTVHVISDIELKSTKAGTWKLSEDKKTYSKIYDENTNYTTVFIDEYNNNIVANIVVTQIDKTLPEINVDYMYNNDDTVTVYLKSNKKLLNNKSSSWKLSEDKTVYSRTYSQKQNYTTTVEDIHGNVTSVKINFNKKICTYNQTDGSNIKVRYLYFGNKKAVVEIVSSIKMQNTKSSSWTLSTDGYKYTREFYSNSIYNTSIKDINGTEKNVDIVVNLFDNYLTGIDVSAHQGKINWSEVRNSGIDFAILRCGYGQDMPSQDDMFFARNVAECERLGIPYGVYLYSYALTEENAISEANHALRLIKGHNPTYGVWIDMEDADGYKQRNGMPSDETLVNISSVFCDRIIANGYKAGVYASLDWLNTKLNSSKLDKYDKWVAQWNDTCSYNKRYQMWQYTSKGNVNGILTNVDMDIYYK